MTVPKLERHECGRAGTYLFMLCLESDLDLVPVQPSLSGSSSRRKQQVADPGIAVSTLGSWGTGQERLPKQKASTPCGRHPWQVGAFAQG